jgi:hypothetical protein
MVALQMSMTTLSVTTHNVPMKGLWGSLSYLDLREAVPRESGFQASRSSVQVASDAQADPFEPSFYIDSKIGRVHHKDGKVLRVIPFSRMDILSYLLQEEWLFS